MNRLRSILSAIGPGIFAIGYTIGTGSVTSMAKAGADYGLGLLWVLALSCLFSGVLMSAYGRFAAVTGETSLHGIVRYLPGGRLIAAAIFLGVVLAQYTCLGGILILTSGAIREAFGLTLGIFPIAAVIMAVMYALMMIGRYSFFEKVLAFFVFLMVLTFIVSACITFPSAEVLAKAAVPLLPQDGASLLMLAAFVGTTMAAPTFVTRPLIVREKELDATNLAKERLDASVAATLMFVISATIMLVATGVLFAEGKGIAKILDMAATLEPVAGRFAVAFFMVGVLAAGLSSVFPILMVGPLLLGDWKDGKMDTKSRTFRLVCLGAALWGLVVPALGSNPVQVTIAAQIANVFVLPLTILAILALLNRRDVMGAHRVGLFGNVTLVLAFLFSLAVAYSGSKALGSFFYRDTGCIFGKIAEGGRYATNERLKKAFEFLSGKDLAELPVGRHEIDGDRVFALVQECTLKSIDQMQIEAHRRYIDIQAPLDGEEVYGYGRLTDENLKLPFDAEKDIGFYRQKVDVVTLAPGEFAMFTPPYAAHGPSCSAGAPEKRKKVVIKVLVDHE